MKKWMSGILAIMIMLSFSVSGAEETAEYRDELFAFRYPASWICDGRDGNVTLIPPDDNTSGVSIVSEHNEIFSLAGDPELDAEYIKAFKDVFGPRFILNADWELIETGAACGYRIYGFDNTLNTDFVMIILTGNNQLVTISLFGSKAIALEGSLLESLELQDVKPEITSENFRLWENPLCTFDYPENYKAGGTQETVLFWSPNNTANGITVSTIALDAEYSETQLQLLCQAAIENLQDGLNEGGATPEEAIMESQFIMTEIGGKRVAVRRGMITNIPFGQYVFGEGKTGIYMLFVGDESISMAAHIIQSVRYK